MTETEKEKTIKYVFNSLNIDSNKYVYKKDIIDLLLHNGIELSDERAAGLVDNLNNFGATQKISFGEFAQLVDYYLPLLERCARGELIIPDFKSFSQKIEEIYTRVIENKSGNVASYIPQLSRVDPEQFAISICTIDGQRLNLGSADKSFCIQSTCKPTNYCIALELNDEAYVHRHVGREPSGRSFNEISLNRQNLPHNPMINAGAIMCASMIKPEESLADRFDHVNLIWKELSGGIQPGYNNSVYHSEKETADRNSALAHFMREVGAFPDKTNLKETLEFYFQCCSIEMNSRGMAAVAATYANSGVSPITMKRVFSNASVRNCLSLMYSCGMYDFSGEFAFTVGLPAKSGVSGTLMMVVPNLMGITIWSPRLDVMGNSVRGVEFCKEFIKEFNYHRYENSNINQHKPDNQINDHLLQSERIFRFINAASQGDINEMKRLIALGLDVNSADYDGRTAMHLACSEGLTSVVKFLLAQGMRRNIKDRWGNTPLEDAERGNHSDIINILTQKKGHS